MSMPISALVGTELMLSAPWIVPTFSVGARAAMRVRVEVEALQRRHGARRLVDRIDPTLGHRSVRGDATGPRARSHSAPL